MAVWEPLAQELQRLLTSSQAFCRVVLQRLEPSQINYSEKEVCTYGEANIIVLLSDSAGDHWWDGLIHPWLQIKAQYQPLVLIQTLPQRYWASTALSNAKQVTFTNRVPLTANSRYGKTRGLPYPWDQPKTALVPDGMNLPVISLDRRELAQWAALVAGEPRARCSGWVFGLVKLPLGPYSAETTAVNPKTTSTDVEHLWEQFESRASQEAQDLLLAMAASPVLSLPILRLLQSANAPRVFSPQPLAEVLVSGLVRRREGQRKDVPPELLQFEMAPAVQRLLEPSLSPDRRRAVLHSVTDLLERHWNRQGMGTSFKALLMGPKDELKKYPDLFHIANITAAMLDRIPGSQFRKLASQLRTETQKQILTDDLENIKPDSKASTLGNQTPHNLPERTTSVESFVGRNHELEQLKILLAPEASSVYITGMGGVGKSELAIQYAFESFSLYRGGIVRLDARQGLVAMASQVVRFVRGTFPAVNLPEDQSKSPIELLPLCWSQWPAGATPPEPVLLILDDQRGDAEGYGAERQLLAGLPPRFRRLITQREPAPLGAKAIDLPLLQREASLELLALQAGEGGTERVKAEEKTADALCAEVGDLPLALVRLGAWLAARPDMRLVQLQADLQAKGVEAKALRQARPQG